VSNHRTRAKQVLGAMLWNHSTHDRMDATVAENISEDYVSNLSTTTDTMVACDVKVTAEIDVERNVDIQNVKSLDLFDFIITEFFEFNVNEDVVRVQFAGLEGNIDTVSVSENGLIENKNATKYMFTVIVKR